MPKCFSAWNAVLNKSVPMHFRHLKNMKHNGTRLVKIWQSLYYKACTNYFPVLLCATSWQDNLLGNLRKESFCSSPHRHGDATGKPETRDETCGRSKTSISCETSSNFDTFDTLSNRLECDKVPRLPRKTTWQPAWKSSKRRGFAASPIDTELTTRRRRDDDATPTRRRRDEPLEANKGPAPRLQTGTLRYAFGKNRIIWDEHPKSSNHQLNAILPITNQHTHNLEFCMLIVISYVIS